MRNFSGPIEEKMGEATEGRASRVKCSEALLEWGGREDVGEEVGL